MISVWSFLCLSRTHIWNCIRVCMHLARNFGSREEPRMRLQSTAMCPKGLYQALFLLLPATTAQIQRGDEFQRTTSLSLSLSLSLSIYIYIYALHSGKSLLLLAWFDIKSAGKSSVTCTEQWNASSDGISGGHVNRRCNDTSSSKFWVISNVSCMAHP